MSFSLKLPRNEGETLPQQFFSVNFSSFTAIQPNFQKRACLEVAWNLVREDQRKYGKASGFNLNGKNACKEKLLYFFANSNKVLVSMALQVFT